MFPLYIQSAGDFRQFIEALVGTDKLQRTFGPYLVNEWEDIKSVYYYKKELEKYLGPLSAEQHVALFREVLPLASASHNETKLSWLADVIIHLVRRRIWSPRMVCDSMLHDDKLVYNDVIYWNFCFGVIQDILKQNDYKGVREVLKGCFEKLNTIPLAASTETYQHCLTRSIIERILSRDSCLLPGYFVINEVKKLRIERNAIPHWMLSIAADTVKRFRPLAQMLTLIGHKDMVPIVEHSGYGEFLITPWKLDPITLKLNIKGNIPYPESIIVPQTRLLRFVLDQPYSRDMVCSMLGQQKPLSREFENSVKMRVHCPPLEDLLVDMIIDAMEQNSSRESDDNGWIWLHLASQLIFFVLFQFTMFQNIIHGLLEKLRKKDLRTGREHVMWILLQFISGSIQRKTLDIFLPVLLLSEFLYPETDPLPVPDINDPYCVHDMAAVCVWIHLDCKAQCDKVALQRPLPLALHLHYEYLHHHASANAPTLTMGSDFQISLLCNAFSTSNEHLQKPMAALVDAVLGPQQRCPTPQSAIQSNKSSVATAPTVPLSMVVLDSLTIHGKMSLIHSVVTYIIKMAQSKSNMALAPALVETYSRLLVYTEIEALGIKGFISQLLPTVFKSHAWGILYTLLEMFSHRMHHIQPHYRVQLLSHLHSLAAVPQTNQTQLHLCVENTALRLITGLGNNEVQPHLSRFLSEPKTLVSSESEELNRALVLTLARSMHITGTGMDSQSGIWCKELLNTIMQNTPHNWAVHTLQCFPPFLAEYFQQNPTPRENKSQLKKAVEEEYRNWTSMTNENDIIAHFSVPGTPPLFLCLLWKMILETDRISPIAYKILERIGARALSAHLRKFCDYLVFKFAISEEGQHVNKCVDAVNSMMWKYNIVTIDRLVLCLALRTQEGSEAQVCFFIIQLLLFKGAEFRTRIQEFVKENTPDHWRQSHWHEKLSAFHRKYPEKFPFDNTDQIGGSPPFQSYFSNICLRFLPVFDILIHRYLEIPPVTKSLENILDQLGCLYKFHDRPVTYLYNTLHYYERKLHDRPSLKRRLVSAILSSYCELRSPGWSLTDEFRKYMTLEKPDWMPDIQYYFDLIKRLVDTMLGRIKFPTTDWRFNEFPNSSAYAVYMTCVEVMCLPASNEEVANALLSVAELTLPAIPHEDIHMWNNCVGLVFAALPESYWRVLHEKILYVVQLSNKWKYRFTPFEFFSYEFTLQHFTVTLFVQTLALAHATWQHGGIGLVTVMPKFIRERLVPIIKSEEQLIFLCHLIGPFLQRYNVDRPSPCVLDLAVDIFTALEQVDKRDVRLKYMDEICDFIYHIKYQYAGVHMKAEVDKIVMRLRPQLQERLRFISHRA